MGRGKAINTHEFIEKAKLIHGDKYDYSKVNYKNSTTKVIIGCKIHGFFEQAPLYHNSQKRGCFLCGIDRVVAGITFSKEQFVEKANKVHLNKYDYSLSIYKNMHTKINIVCNQCGNNFVQEPNNHIKEKNGCPKCNGGHKLTKNEFINRAKQIHLNSNYDYSLVEYVNVLTLIKIICSNPKHGMFLQMPATHLAGGGCQKCKSSRGEQKIINFLENNKINFTIQKKFSNCKVVKLLPFDFYLPDYNVCIEYDGIQHFKPIEKFGGEKGFLERIKYDNIKNKFCETNKIKLIRISYLDNVYTTLHNLLIELSIVKS